MLRLNPNTPKHKEFIDATQFLFRVTIDYRNIAQTLHNQIMEAAQEKVTEDIGEPHELFQ